MSTQNNRPIAIRPQVLPPESTNDIHMPSGTPLGLGVFGAMKYAAIRRVLEEYEKARRAKDLAHRAEAGEADALVEREIARERLRNIGTILEDEANRIRHAYDARLREEADAKEVAEIAKLRRSLEKLEIQERIDIVQARSDTRKSQDSDKTTRDEQAEILATIARVPPLMDAVRAAKAQIDATGNGSDEDQGIKDVLDALAQSFVAKHAESKFL